MLMISSTYKNLMDSVPSGTKLNRDRLSDVFTEGLRGLKADASSAAAMKLKIFSSALSIIIFSTSDRNERACESGASCLNKIHSLNALFSSMGLPLFTCDEVAQDHEVEVAAAIQELSMA